MVTSFCLNAVVVSLDAVVVGLDTVSDLVSATSFFGGTVVSACSEGTGESAGRHFIFFRSYVRVVICLDKAV